MEREKLFEIENNEELFSFRFEAYNLPMWAFIRYSVMMSIYYKLFDAEEKTEPYDEYIPQKKMLKYYLRSALNPPFSYYQKDIVFIFSNVGEYLNSEGLYENIYYGSHFLAAKEKSSILQMSYNYTYATPSVDENIRFYDMINFLIKRDKTEVSASDLKNIDGMISFIKENSCVPISDKVLAKAKNKLLSTASKIRPAVKLHRKLYDNINPKAVILDCAHYLGGLNPVRSYVAKEMGIKVLEIQHGMINNICVPYIFGTAALKDKGFVNLLPDYYLMFGDYWKQFINTPAQCVSIGNPTFYKKEKANTSKKSILVLYNIPEAPDKCLSNYAIQLAKQLPDYNVTYRFHPYIKRSDEVLKRLDACKNLNNLKIDTSVDIYTSLYEHDHLISDSSTVLYEAACLKKKVYSLKTRDNVNFIDPNMFVVFETPGELVEKVRRGEGIVIDDKTKESIFGSGFPGTYYRLLSEIGINV